MTDREDPRTKIYRILTASRLAFITFAVTWGIYGGVLWTYYAAPIEAEFLNGALRTYLLMLLGVATIVSACIYAIGRFAKVLVEFGGYGSGYADGVEVTTRAMAGVSRIPQQTRR